ncbi:MAG: glycosyltransferase family 2 protein [Phycisphaeraceae bacterium]
MPAQDTDNPPAPRRLVIVPAYNEADSIGEVVRTLRAAVPDYDVLVVDDGSTDGTARAVPAGARVVRLPFNQGIGGAMQTGYRFAEMHGYDVAVQVDGDGQHPADQVPRLVETLEREGVDVVVGSRFLDARSYRPPASRMLGIHMLRALLRVLAGQRVTDCTSGFRAAGRRAICAFAYWYPEDYPEPEVILLLRRGGYTVREVAVEMNPRTTGTTSIPLHAGVFYVLKVSVALLLDLFRGPWPKERVRPS